MIALDGKDDGAHIVPRYLTTKQAAEYLGAKPKQLESWRYQGCGPKYVKKSARFLRYDVCDLDAWMAQGRIENTAQEPEEHE